MSSKSKSAKKRKETPTYKSSTETFYYVMQAKNVMGGAILMHHIHELDAEASPLLDTDSKDIPEDIRNHVKQNAAFSHALNRFQFKTSLYVDALKHKLKQYSDVHALNLDVYIDTLRVIQPIMGLNEAKLHTLKSDDNEDINKEKDL